MASADLEHQYLEYVQTQFREGYLDDQFSQLQLLQDPETPGFVAEVITLFFEDTEKLLDDLTKAVYQEPMDFKRVDAIVHQFKGSSSSVGCHRVKDTCISFRLCCDQRNREGCFKYLQQVKQEFYMVKGKLEHILQMEEQITNAGGTVPIVE